jgi:glucose-6-phosphate 1-dehydrogenase
MGDAAEMSGATADESPKPADPCTLVIFGGAGDLTRRLLTPALYNLRRSGLLPEKFAIVGVARADMNDEAFRKDLSDGLDHFARRDIDEADRLWLTSRASYLRSDFDDADGYERLKQKLAAMARENGTGQNCLFYLATPAQAFETIIEHLGAAGLAKAGDGFWRRVIIEKPFGFDLPSARALNAKILAVLSEDQIYRIDHYLGKETVQNILVFRFANGIFEPLWNRDHIDHVQITVSETVGVETRGKFYDATGALRDMVPNHLCQLLSLTAMEPPARFDADALRTEKAKVLEAVQHYTPEEVGANVVRAQYGAGRIGDALVEAYRGAPNVSPTSTTETYVAIKLKIDNWRWAGVPFYLRTGKALAKRQTEVAIQFKQAPFALFRDTPVDRLTQNDLIIHIQPDEGVTLRFSAKQPGPDVHMGGVEMKFNYGDYFKATPNTGYETLIYDCMKGDATLFQRADNIEAGWRIVQPILDAWRAAGDADLPSYPAGSSGPGEADALLDRDGKHWRRIDRGPKSSLPDAAE